MKSKHPITPERRVRGLLACGFWSPFVRDATIRSLLNDPATAPLVPSSALRDPRSALNTQHSTLNPA